MKILVVAHDSNFNGGANRSLIMVMEKLIKDYGVFFEVITPKKNGPLNKKLDEMNIKYYSLPYFGAVSVIRDDGKDWMRRGKVFFGYYIENLWSIIFHRKLKNSEFDLVYTNTRLPILGALIAKRLNIPHVVHAREFLGDRPLFGKWGYKEVYRFSSRIILISNSLRNDFANHVPNDKLIAIHNGIDSPLGLAPAFLNNKNKKNSIFNILITGRLVPDKAQLDAIKATELLINENRKKIHLHIVGSTPNIYDKWYADGLYKYVDENGLNGFVTFHGEVSDMVAIRKGMDIELMCAPKETFGRVTVEGMRSGLFLIGTNSGGTPEIITDYETGLLYEAENVEDLKEKIKIAINDSFLFEKIAKKGYGHAISNFTPEKNVSEIYQVFVSVIK